MITGPRLLTAAERSLYRSATRPSPHVLKQLATHVASKVVVGWSWYDETNGVVEWTFTNEDTVAHSVILLRNSYYFAGAFWPVYYANSSGRGASATDPNENFGVDWATSLSPLVDKGVADNAPPIALSDFGGGNRTVTFLFTLGPGETWSMLEGGFSASMTPSGASVYEATLEKSGQFCIGYDPQRVADWDAQTGTSLQGYSPNPDTFTTVEVSVESDAPFDVLPFADSYADGPCAPSGGGGGQPTDCTQLIIQGAQEIGSGQTEQGVADIVSGIECLFTQGILVKKEFLKRVLGEAPQELKDAIEKLGRL